jgi:hypothetical protein
MPTDLVSRADRYREIAGALRLLVSDALPEHRRQLIEIAGDLEAMADTVDEGSASRHSPD